MEVSKVQAQMPLNFKTSSNDEKSTVKQKQFVKSDKDNTKVIALSLAALAAAGAAFVIGKNSAKTKEIIKEVIKEAPKASDDAAGKMKKETESIAQKADTALKTPAKKAAETGAKKIEDIVEFYPNGYRKSIKVFDKETGKPLQYVENYANGQTKQVIEYNKDGAVASFTSYYPNGQKSKVVDKMGHTTTFYPSGVMKTKGGSGSTTYYTKDGILEKRIENSYNNTRETNYINGTVKEIELNKDGSVNSIYTYGKNQTDKEVFLKEGKIFKEVEGLEDGTRKVRVIDTKRKNKEVYSSIQTPEMLAAHRRQMVNKARTSGKDVHSYSDGGMYVEHPTTTRSAFGQMIDKTVDNMKDKIRTVTQYFGKGIKQEKVYDLSAGVNSPKLKKLTLIREDGSKKVTEFLDDGTKKITEYLSDGSLKA